MRRAKPAAAEAKVRITVRGDVYLMAQLLCAVCNTEYRRNGSQDTVTLPHAPMPTYKVRLGVVLVVRDASRALLSSETFKRRGHVVVNDQCSSGHPMLIL